jgi:hypothetical protein
MADGLVGGVPVGISPGGAVVVVAALFPFAGSISDDSDLTINDHRGFRVVPARGYWSVVAVLVPSVLVGLSAPLSGQQQARLEESFFELVDRQLVVVRDLLVAPPSEKALEAADLAVRVGDAEASVVALTPPGEVSERWQVVLYFDSWWGSSRELRHAALLLASATQALTALGPVDLVVMGEHNAEVRLRATSDETRLRELLSWISLQEQGAAVATARRLELVAAEPREAVATDSALDSEPGERLRRIERARAWELTAARAAQDRLLAWLLENAKVGDRRLLVPVGVPSLEDDDPFWLAVGGAATLVCAQTGDALLGLDAAAMARTLSPLGWTVLFPWAGASSAWDVVAPDADARGPGFDDPTSKVSGGAILYKMMIAEDRKPELARKYLDLARQHLIANDRVAGEEALRRSIHYFFDGRKTWNEEAEVWLMLGDLLASSERPDPAARAYRHSLELEDRALERAGTRVVDLPARAASARADLEIKALTGSASAAPGAASRVAEGTGGAAVYDGATLTAALAELAKRWRVTVQLPQQAQSAGALESLGVVVRRSRGRGEPLVAARFLAVGTPLRALLAAGSTRLTRPEHGSQSGGLGRGLEVWFEGASDAVGAAPSSSPRRLTLVDPAAVAGTVAFAGPWRVAVTTAPTTAGCPPSAFHAPVTEATVVGSDRIALELDLTTLVDRLGEVLYVVAEDLATGRWGVGR